MTVRALACRRDFLHHDSETRAWVVGKADSDTTAAPAAMAQDCKNPEFDAYSQIAYGSCRS